MSTVTFLTHPGMSPGCLHTFCQSMSGKILFKNIFKNIIIFLARDLGQFHDISWHWIMTGIFCHEWMKMLKFLFQTFLTISLRFYRENSKSESLITCHLSPVSCHLAPVKESLGRLVQNYGIYWFCSVWQKIHKSSSSRSILEFSMDSWR